MNPETPESSAAAPAAPRPMMSDEEYHRRLRRNYWMDFAAYTISGGFIGGLCGFGLIRFLIYLFG